MGVQGGDGGDKAPPSGPCRHTGLLQGSAGLARLPVPSAQKDADGKSGRGPRSVIKVGGRAHA